jgi:hypothetical protein
MSTFTRTLLYSIADTLNKPKESVDPIIKT